MYIYANLHVLRVTFSQLADSMIPHDFFQTSLLLFCPPLLYVSPFLSLIRISHLFCPYPLSDHFSPLFSSLGLLFRIPNPTMIPFHSPGFSSYSGYVLTAEDLAPGAWDERDLARLPCLLVHSQYGLFQFHLFTCKIHDFIFIYSWIVFQGVCKSHFIIHSPVERQLGCFLYRATVTRAATNTAEQVSLEWDAKFFAHVPRSGIPGSFHRFSLVLRIHHTASHMHLHSLSG